MKEDQKNSRKNDNKLIYNCTQLESIYMIAKLLGLRVCFYLFLKFNSNILWTCDNYYPNSLRPNFPTHSLQIYCLGLIGLLYNTFGPQIETLQLVFLILLKKIFFFPFLAVYYHSLSLNLPYIWFLLSFSSDFWLKFVKCIYVSTTFLLYCVCLFLKIKLKI